jgi:hypothetical protein
VSEVQRVRGEHGPRAIDAGAPRRRIPTRPRTRARFVAPLLAAIVALSPMTSAAAPAGIDDAAATSGSAATPDDAPPSAPTSVSGTQPPAPDAPASEAPTTETPPATVGTIPAPAKSATATLPAAPAPATAAENTEAPAKRAPVTVAPDPMANQVGAAWRHCVPGYTTCTRPRPARWLLGALGLTLAGAGTAYLLFVGDSLRAGDPGGFIAGGGMAALGGAVLGGLYGLMGGDRRGDADRLRPSTFAFDYTSGGAPRLDEQHPGEIAFRFAPNFYFRDGGGRLRLFGHVGGIPGRETDVDPRPQVSEVTPGSNSTQPVALGERLLSVGVGTDLAVALPYPLLRRSAHLGAAEIRWRPEVQIRRHDLGDRVIERTILLPLTIGFRWYLSPRQRFTTYVGPRLDFIAVADTGDKLDRGAPNVGSLYGEAWYDIDVPLLVRPSAPVRLNGMFTLGYVHSRFDGHGINLGGAYGFLGPAYAGWHMRLRRRGKPAAVQVGFGAWFGSGFAAMFSAGVVLPDLGGKKP